jgi:hypothetical protein
MCIALPKAIEDLFQDRMFFGCGGHVEREADSPKLLKKLKA